MSIWLYAGLFVALPGTALAGVYYYYNVFRIHALKRAEFIRGYQWPRGDFSNPNFDGTTAGFSDSDASATASSDGGGDGGSDGGSCGGGGCGGGGK